jgi:benzoyl-CoA reductase subunit C
MVISAMLDYANFNILKEIESAGANIVVDHSCVGTRNVSDDVVENGDPLRSIVQRYLDRIPCPTKYPTKPWFDDIMELTNDYRVDGVIFLIEKFCDAHGWTYPHLRDFLEKNTVKTLRLELGEAIAPMGQIRTRVGAFCEMIKGKKS